MSSNSRAMLLGVGVLSMCCISSAFVAAALNEPRKTPPVVIEPTPTPEPEPQENDETSDVEPQDSTENYTSF